MRWYTSLVLALAAAPLVGCAGQAVISNAKVEDYYEPRMLAYPASRGGMYTEVTGNPFQTEKATLDRTVTQAFEASHFGPRLEFFSEIPAEGAPGFRTVVLFNPARNANAKHLCSRPERRQEPYPAGRVGVMGALCNSEARLTSATGFVSGVEGPDDPAFRRLLKQLALSLFPPASGVRRDDQERTPR